MTKHSQLITVPVALLAIGAIAACGASAPRSSSSATATTRHVVTLDEILFHPAVLRIHRDDSVTWRWEDADLSTEHDVTSIGGAHFQGSAAKMAGSYTVTFRATGTYAFECSIHPASMQGKVIVS